MGPDKALYISDTARIVAFSGQPGDAYLPSVVGRRRVRYEWVD
jgi:hypothetical protein